MFPDPPEIPEDKMTNFDHLAVNGNVHHLAIHFGNPETTLVAGERYRGRGANPGHDRAALP